MKAAKKPEQNHLMPDGQQRYKWVPAAMEWNRRGGAGIYVRYHSRVERDIVIKDKSPGHIWVDAPDRELIIVSNEQHVHSFRPMQGNYDEYVCLSPFHEQAAVDLNFEMFMVNYTHYIGKEHTASRIRSGPGRSPNTKIIADSGGFQIWRGDIEYIDPNQLIQFYNDNVDLGMVLDIPSNVVGVKHFERLAKIQARNTQILMDNKRPDLELFNVFHGSTPDEIAKFRGITERDDIDRLAIGGGYWGTVMQSISRWMGIFNEGRRYQHYHILGVANILQSIPLMRMASKNIAPLITSDSTTHVQNAVSKGYYFHPAMDVAPGYTSIGYRGTPYRPNHFNTLPCNCVVCTTLKYKDVLAAISGNSIDVMLTYHNLFATQKYMRTMYETMYDMPTKELKALVTHQFNGGKSGKKTKRSGVEETYQALDFIDAVEKDGLASARKHFRHFLPTSAHSVGSNATLFNRNTFSKEFVTPETDPAWIATNAVAIRYEAQSGEHGKKIKKKGASAIQSVKAAKGPGKNRKKAKAKKKSKPEGTVSASTSAAQASP